jgi:hypothetical protein
VFYAGINLSNSKRSQSKLPDAEYFVAQTEIDAFSPHVCILNKTGDILIVNQAWRNFTTQTVMHLFPMFTLLGFIIFRFVIIRKALTLHQSKWGIASYSWRG